jgi:hypothetical protein
MLKGLLETAPLAKLKPKTPNLKPKIDLNMD